MRLRSRRSHALAAAALAGLLAAAYAGRIVLDIGLGYTAKVLCSGVFVAHRTVDSVRAVDLAADELAVLTAFDTRVDRYEGTVSAGWLGLIERRAVYRPGLGCALAYDGYALPALVVAPSHAAPLPSAPDRRLDVALDWAFAEPDPRHLRRTRAVVVMRDGHIVAERYAPGFDSNTPLAGWSLAKSVLNALVGILIRDGRLALNQRVPIAEWARADDGRGDITLDQLLRMSSGLAFGEEGRHPFEDVITMLLRSPDAAGYAATRPLQALPGRRWHYASGNANIVSRWIRYVLGDAEYHRFPRRALFDPLGMTDATLEADASGTFVGSSFMYASARDWARLGQLYLQDGVWNGERILPEGWAHYTATPAPAAPAAEYGALFWRKPHPDYLAEPNGNTMPPDAFHAVGHEAQFVTVIPSRRLVVVRLGLTRHAPAWKHDLFIARLLAAIEP